MMQTRMAGAALAVGLLAGAACASLRGGFKEPIVSFREGKVTGLGVSGGSIEVALDVYNPNSFRLDGSKLTYTIYVDSVKVGDGLYDSRFQVERGDTSTVRLPLSFTYAGIGAVGNRLMQTGSVEYRVAGEITVGTPIGSFTRPYDQKGRYSTLSR